MSDPLDRWGDFAKCVQARLEKGRHVYQDRSFSADPAELLEEIQQEALDLAGWGFVLWHRLEALRAAISRARVMESAR